MTITSQYPDEKYQDEIPTSSHIQGPRYLISETQGEKQKGKILEDTIGDLTFLTLE